MTDAERFLEEWSQENISATMYGDRDTAGELASTCRQDAQVQGIGEADLIAASGGDLVAYMLSALNRATDELVRDRVARDRT